MTTKRSFSDVSNSPATNASSDNNNNHNHNHNNHNNSTTLMNRSTSTSTSTTTTTGMMESVQTVLERNHNNNNNSTTFPRTSHTFKNKVENVIVDNPSKGYNKRRKSNDDGTNTRSLSSSSSLYEPIIGTTGNDKQQSQEEEEQQDQQQDQNSQVISDNDTDDDNDHNNKTNVITLNDSEHNAQQEKKHLTQLRLFLKEFQTTTTSPLKDAAAAAAALIHPMTGSLSSSSSSSSILPDPTVDGVTPDAFLAQLVKAQSNLTVCVQPAKELTNYFTRVTDDQTAAYTAKVVTVVRTNDLVGLQTLVETQGQRLDCFNRFGESILHMACRRGFDSIVHYLLQQHGEQDYVRICDDCGRTVLHDACWNPTPQLEICKWILQRDPTLFLISDNRGFTPFQYARSEHWPIWRQFLFDHRECLFRGLYYLPVSVGTTTTTTTGAGASATVVPQQQQQQQQQQQTTLLSTNVVQSTQ